MLKLSSLQYLPATLARQFEIVDMADPDEIVELFLNFPGELSQSQKSDYDRYHPSNKNLAVHVCLQVFGACLCFHRYLFNHL